MKVEDIPLIQMVPKVFTGDGFSGKIDNGYTGITTNPSGNKISNWSSIYKGTCRTWDK